jgi:RES domain-containing protein
MQVWRLCPQPFADRLDGEGNRRNGARWNSSGRGVVYTCEHLSLSVLETLVHVDPADIPDNLMGVCLQIPDQATALSIPADQWPIDWENGSHDTWFKQQGDAWLSAGLHLMLISPSIILPTELNVMLNPQHPLMKQVQEARQVDVRLDSRLLST